MSSSFSLAQRKVAVAILSPSLAPYRIPVFNRLAQIPNLDLEVLFATDQEHAESWGVAAPQRNFKWQLLPSQRKAIVSELGDTTGLYWSRGLWQQLNRGRYDGIVTLGWTTPNSAAALAFGKTHRCPVLLWEESIPHPPSRAKRTMMPLIRLYIHSFDGFLAASNACAKYLESLGAAQRDITLMPQVVDNEFFCTRSAAARANFGESKRALGVTTRYLILFVGQFSKRKGVLSLLEAFRTIAGERKDVSLMLVGQGPLEQEIHVKANEYGIGDRVFLKGQVGQVDLPSIYGAADIFVLPSLYDTFGVVIGEAMACGLPIVTTRNVGAVSSIVQPGVNGLVIAPDSTAELTDALGFLLKADALRAEMGAASQRIIAEWNLEMLARNFSRAVSKCMPERGIVLREKNEDCLVQ